MGIFRRLTESTLQKVPFGSDKNFEATLNDRNNAMIKEARVFAIHLKNLQTELTQWDKNVSTGLKTFATVLKANLPKTYDNSPTGPTPIDLGDRLIGIGVDVPDIEAASEDMHNRIQAEVLKPLDDWLKAYRTIKDRNKQVEDLRLELDSRRRSATAAAEKVTAGQSKGVKNLEALNDKAQNEENKLKLTLAQYQTLEMEVNTSLHALIRDTGVLREYAAAGLLVMQTTFTRSYNAFNLQISHPSPSPPGMPYQPQSSPPPYSMGGGEPSQSYPPPQAYPPPPSYQAHADPSAQDNPFAKNQ